MKLVDLTVVLSENTPVYPGDPKTKIDPQSVFERDGFDDSYVSVGTHAGTHIDAPAHMVKNGKKLDQIPIERFFGRGVYIKVEGQFDLGQIKEADIQEDDMVLFDTGMSAHYFESEYYENHPVLSTEVAEYLAYKKVRMVGVDMCSIDAEPYEAHKILLRNDVLIIENLTNLAPLFGQEFKVCALPIKLQLDGAPARVVAEIIE